MARKEMRKAVAASRVAYDVQAAFGAMMALVALGSVLVKMAGAQ